MKMRLNILLPLLALVALPVCLQAQFNLASPGVRTNQFGFTLTGTNGQVLVVEASPNLAHPSWSPVSTNTLADGTSYFSDSQWTNYPSRFYRFRAP